ncbi:DNA recombination protein RmuC [Derxia gummosa]|uniref:DNA recombination protein RmuC n=1 Tax=Derxia gummosa DSM 723 TaxID=1121388 RepID=A0A8B6X3K3_9BURK|nr:DNA recombination protein RmuC [Derxia gummosa]
MTDLLLAAVLVLLIAALGGLALVLRRLGGSSGALDALAEAEAAADQRAGQLALRIDQVARGIERTERELRDAGADHAARQRNELGQRIAQLQQLVNGQLGALGEQQSARLRELGEAQHQRLRELAEQQHIRLRELTETLERKVHQLQADNGQRLDDMRQTMDDKLAAVQQAVDGKLAEVRGTVDARLGEMRQTVDEKLHATLESRLGEAFRQVSERLERVHQGLGEMQTLAQGVGDLKRVLGNVKTRGNLGEVQLGALLEDLLAPEQFARNVSTKPGSRDMVEFALRLPGRGDAPVWLPIDAKFPVEDYERLLAAQDAADPAAAEIAAKALENRLRLEARSIADKYLAPPATTDFAVLFLPTEGLYAECLRRPGLTDDLQRRHRITVAGPTTLAAMLNALQMGFRTLAIEKRSSEVWALLGTVKTEFGKFGDVLAKSKTQLQTVLNTMDAAEVRTRAIERNLRGVQAVPVEEVAGEGGAPKLPGATEA